MSDVSDVNARAGSIHAESEGGKGYGRSVAGRDDERSMDEDLKLVVAAVQGCGLHEEYPVLICWIPTNCQSADYECMRAIAKSWNIR